MGTVKRGREEEGRPMFPRLRVSEAAAEKGGMRAPPRNKMALYEQLSVPARNSGASTSAAKGCGSERSFFFPCYPHTSAPMPDMFHSHSLDEMNRNASRTELERGHIMHPGNRTSNATVSVVESSLPRPHDDSRGEIFTSEDKDDPMVPTFLQSGIPAYSSRGTAIVEPGRISSLCTRSLDKLSSTASNSLLRFPCSSDEPPEKTTTDILKSIKDGWNTSEEKFKENPLFKDLRQKSVSHLGYGEESMLPSNIAKPSLDQYKRSASNPFRDMRYEDGKVDQESSGDVALVGSKRLKNTDTVKGDALKVTSESCPQVSTGNITEKLNVSNKGNRQTTAVAEEAANLSFKTVEAERIDETSESSMLDCPEISPDDVVDTIGTKHFWEARRAIVNQQRIFEQQVFELHRLIKVQKLIAASPHLLLEGNSCLSIHPPEVPGVSPSHDLVARAGLKIARPGDESQNLSENIECPIEKSGRDTPIPPREEGLGKGLTGQVSKSGAFSGKAPAVTMAPSSQATSWCVPQPQNQWLIPVMSPSEGLIYKPYTGPCPPTGGFLAPPLYGSCAPLSLPPIGGDFMNTPCVVPTSYQQQNMNMAVLSGIHPNYFGSGFPVPNPIMSTSAVEQVGPLDGSKCHGQAAQHSRSSCNMPNSNNAAFSGYPWQFQASKDTELQQGSTASSPCEKAREKRDTLPLFPMSQTVADSSQPSASCSRDNQPRAIKVVPLNARSATESAARIFRSIQEERGQYGS